MRTTMNPTVTGISPSKGSLIGNIMVTITGSGFTGATAVNFGTAGATNIEVVSDTEITVTNPNTGTPGPVHVTVMVNSNSSLNTSADLFDYKIPEVTGLNPSASSLAGNETITISGKYFTGAAGVNFGQAGATNVVVLSDTKITVTNPKM